MLQFRIVYARTDKPIAVSSYYDENQLVSRLRIALSDAQKDRVCHAFPDILRIDILTDEPQGWLPFDAFFCRLDEDIERCINDLQDYIAN